MMLNWFISEIQGSPGIQTGPIIGGVSGGLIFLVLILVIVVAMVLTMRCLNRQGKEGNDKIIVIYIM